MFDNSYSMMISNSAPLSNEQLKRSALHLYQQAMQLGRISRIWAGLQKKSHRLAELEAVQNGDMLGAHHAGLRAVAIEKIRGTEGRSDDFDRSFYPLNERTRDRWLNIAKLRLEGRPLPPVELIQVGDSYFVRDGHHRISVARAFGQTAIDAQVTVVMFQ
jgi:hypothetical protein